MMNLTKKIFLFIFTLSLLLVLNSCNPKSENIKTNNNSAKKTQPVEQNNERFRLYTNDRFKFSVLYPKEWNSKVDQDVEATKDRDASPDSGIEIYINGAKDNWVWVRGCVSPYTIPGPFDKVEKLKTHECIEGDLYTEYHDNRVDMYYLINNKGNYGAGVRADKDVFEAKKEMIFSIFKSIKILK